TAYAAEKKASDRIPSRHLFYSDARGGRATCHLHGHRLARRTFPLHRCTWRGRTAAHFRHARLVPLMAVPFFVLAGVIMEQGGISTRLIELSKALVGHFRGGLALVTVLAMLVFSGLSGAGVADVAAIGAIMIPALIGRGYSRGYAAALLGASGALGPIIPPSIIMILYAALVNQSPARMFMGGILPGITIGL